MITHRLLTRNQGKCSTAVFSIQLLTTECIDA
jgi:hypothetical protein